MNMTASSVTDRQGTYYMYNTEFGRSSSARLCEPALWPEGISRNRGTELCSILYSMYLEYDARSEEPFVHVEQAQGGVAHLAVVEADTQLFVAFEDDLEDDKSSIAGHMTSRIWSKTSLWTTK